MAQLYRITPASQNPEQRRADLAGFACRAISNLMASMQTASGISAAEAEEAVINGCAEYITARLIARPDGLAQAIHLRNELVPYVTTGKKQAGVL